MARSTPFIIISIFFYCNIYWLKGQDLHFHLLDQSKELSNEFNAYFSIDKEGYFWTSSRDGLNRFDGQTVNVYRPVEKGTTLDPNITSQIFEDKSGNKWFTSNNALHCLRIDSDSVEIIPIIENSNSYHYAFHLENDSLLWLIIGENLGTVPILEDSIQFKFKHKINGFTAYPWVDEHQQILGLVRPTIELKGGIELIRYQPEISRDTLFYDRNTVYQDTFIFYLYPENDTSFWLPSSVGLIHFNPYCREDFHIYKHDSTKTKFSYRDVKSWNSKFLWLASLSEGLMLFDKEKNRIVERKTSYNVEGTIKEIGSLNKIMVDEKENLWLSFFDSGILYTSLKNNKFDQLLPYKTLLSSKQKEVRSIIKNDDGSLFLLVKNEGIYRSILDSPSSKTWEKVDVECCSDSLIYSITRDRENNIWMICDGNIFKWDIDLNHCFHKLRSSKYTYEWVETKDGDFLLLEIDKLYRIPKNNSFVNTDTLQPLLSNISLASRIFYWPEDDLLFLIQSNNLIRIFKYKEKLHKLKNIENIGHVNGMYKSKYKDSIWIASSTGLYVYSLKAKEASRVNTPNDSLNRSFTDVLEDRQGKLWLSSYWGIYAFDPNSKKVDHFTQSDGLYTMQYEENVSLFNGDNGLLFFAGDNGVTIIDPLTVELNRKVPKVVLEQVFINDQKMDRQLFFEKKKFPVLSYSQNNLLFQFTIIEYSDPEQNRIETFLIRNGQDTVARGQTAAINLPNLQSGKYRLDCYAYNSDGIRTKEAFQLFFTIKPPWYLSWAAIILWTALLIGSLYFWYRYRIRQVEKREMAKRREAEFKQKEAEYKQLVAETETAVLRLQMNPHFIFNSMNSISSYISQKDIATANEYLHRFAQLMRKILELSENPFIDLEEEIAFLNLYLEAESMRMGKKLNYRFEIAPELDQEETLIPTMILQPFVENAIWHGISKRKEGGLILIRFLKEEGTLLCEVEDNGLGRNFSEGMTSQSHKSKAIAITKKRMELLFGESKQVANIEIKDLKDAKMNAIGTKVQLYIPFL